MTFDSYNSRTALSYMVMDSVSNTNVDLEAPLGWSNSYYLTPSVYDPNSMSPSKMYISYTDSFVVSGAGMNPIKVILTGGTFDSSIWSGNYTAQVVLTYIDY